MQIGAVVGISLRMDIQAVQPCLLANCLKEKWIATEGKVQYLPLDIVIKFWYISVGKLSTGISMVPALKTQSFSMILLLTVGDHEAVTHCTGLGTTEQNTE